MPKRSGNKSPRPPRSQRVHRQSYPNDATPYYLTSSSSPLLEPPAKKKGRRQTSSTAETLEESGEVQYFDSE